MKTNNSQNKTLTKTPSAGWATIDRENATAEALPKSGPQPSLEGVF